MRRRSCLLGLVLVAGALSLPAEARNKAEAPKPIGSPAAWFDPSNYPADALRAGAQGRAVVGIAVDERGVPAQCTVVTSTGNASLDRVTCDLAMKNARFTPARNERGQPIPSRVALPVRWVLPSAMGPAASFSFVDRIEIAPDGALLSCVTEGPPPLPDMANGSCRLFQNKPPLLTLALRGGEMDGTVTAFFQMAFTMEGDPAVTEAHLLPGRIMTGVVRAKVEIAADGTVSSCRVVESAGGLGRFPACTLVQGPFDPAQGAVAGKARSGTMLTAFSYEVRKP